MEATCLIRLHPSPYYPRCRRFRPTSNGGVLLEMEYVDGHPFAPTNIHDLRKQLLEVFKVLTFNGFFPSLLISETSMQVLNDMHSKGIVHRDIKPDHILVSESSQCTVKLVDFGLATPITQVKAHEASDCCGTIPYIAPEVRVPCRFLNKILIA